MHANNRKKGAAPPPMKKVLLVLPVVVILVTLVASASAFACGGDCGCDCGCDAGCSPGYWKTHTEWMSDTDRWNNPAYEMGNPQFMLDALWAKGNDPIRPWRSQVMEALNIAYPDAPCHD